MPNRPPRKYNLDELHGGESSLRRYIRLTVGEDAGLAALLWHEALLGVCTGLPGLVGFGGRSLLYPLCFRGIHQTARLARHVTLRCPRQIRLGRGVVIDEFVQLIATSRRADAITLAEGCSLRSFAMLNAGSPDGFIHMGERTGIGQGVLLYGNGGLTIGKNVMIAAHTSVIASSHVYTDPDKTISEQGYTARGIIIGDNVWIGAGVRVLDGVEIGEGAVVGANAVVNRPVAPRSIVAGVPAREIGRR